MEGSIKTNNGPLPEGLVRNTPAEAMLVQLTPRQASFCRHYAETNNGTQSAIAAGYSDKSASVVASRMIRDPKIKAAIERLKLEQSADLDVTDAAVLEGLLREATREGKCASHAARVSAWAKLTEIKGMTKNPDMGAWTGITTLRIELALPGGETRALELRGKQDPTPDE